MSDLSARVLAGVSLDRIEAAAFLEEMLADDLTDEEIGAALQAMASRGETAEEIAGFVDTMRQRMTAVSLPTPVADNCGTGGDGAGTFNISTTAALMVAACGLPVAKHGNRAASSKTGSADLLEKMGYQFPKTVEEVGTEVARCSFAFLFAPYFHPAMARLRKVRSELGIRTIFNLLGPLSNPAGATIKVLGVSSPNLMGTLGDVAVATNGAEVSRLLVVHSADGMDEFSLSAPTAVREWNGREWRSYSVSPSDVGLLESPRSHLRAADVSESAVLAGSALNGVQSPVYDCTLFNAAALWYLAGRADSIADAVGQLRERTMIGKITECIAHILGHA